MATAAVSRAPKIKITYIRVYEGTQLLVPKIVTKGIVGKKHIYI